MFLFLSSWCPITLLSNAVLLVGSPILQSTPPFNLFVALDVQRHASAEFDELVNQHKQLIEQRDAARSDAEKASALVKTAKVTREAMANTTKAKGKTKAVTTSKDVSKKRSSDNPTSEGPHKKKRAGTRQSCPIKGRFPPAGPPDATNNDSDAHDEATATKSKTSKKAAKKTSNNTESTEDKTSSLDTDVAVKKKSAKNKTASNNADMVDYEASPSYNDVDAANVPDALTKLHANQSNPKAPSQPPKGTTAASAKSNKTPSEGNVGAQKPGESAKRKKRLPMNTIQR
jgi:hypothetical protein